jgi:hypothetical protein
MIKLFLVTTYQSDNDSRLEQALALHYRDAYYPVGRGQWMVTAKSTAADVAKNLGIFGDQNPLSGAYVICVSEYAGLARNELGEWMDAKAPRRKRLLKGLFKSRQGYQPFFWQAKRLALDLVILVVSAAMSFLVAYLLLSSGKIR